MAIQTEITRINDDKSAIKTAIESKGDITIPNDTLLDDFSAYVDSINVGGVVDMEKYLSSDGITRLVLTSDIAMPVTTELYICDEPFFDCKGLQELVIQSDAVIPNNAFSYFNKFNRPSGSPIEKIIIESAAYCERNYAKGNTPVDNPCLSYALVFDNPIISRRKPNVPICPKIVIDCEPTRLGNYLFAYFGKLQSIFIPSTVTEIGDYAFYECFGMTTVYCEATTPPTASSNIFDGCDVLAHIYVPSQSVEAYKTAWSNYASIIEAMPS